MDSTRDFPGGPRGAEPPSSQLPWGPWGAEPPSTSPGGPRGAEPPSSQIAATRKAWQARREDKIAVLVFDQSDRKLNTLGERTMTELVEVVDDVEKLADRGELDGVVIESGKPDSFVAGADIDAISTVTDPQPAKDASRRGQELFNRIAALAVPTVAVIDGVCLGGGFELALACDFRVATTGEKVSIGLPEVLLGILPAWGGTQRLSRLLGPATALDMILAGKTFDGRRALRKGLVDALCPRESSRKAALDLIASARGKVRPFNRRPFSLKGLLLEGNPLGRALLFKMARRQLGKKVKPGEYPAPFKALEAIRLAGSTSLAEGLAAEAEMLSELIVTPTCKNLVGVFSLREATRKNPGVEGTEPLAIQRAGVLGAGVMGAGIAQLMATRRIAVRLRDVDEKFVAAGMGTAWKLFSSAVERKRLDRREAVNLFRLISPTVGLVGFRHADLVLEAVVEDLEVKKKVLAEVEASLGEGAILATNTSSLSVDDLAAALARPQNFVGLHFFNPVHRMPLVEVVRGSATSDVAVATAVALAKRLGKNPIVVADAPGFLVNRILMPYFNEAGLLVEGGVPFPVVDRAMVEFGMPMGPFRLLDEVGIDVAAQAGRVLATALRDRARFATLSERIHGSGLLGKKGGKGFYVHRKGKATVNRQVLRELGAGISPIDDDTIRQRILYAMVNEASRCLSENVVAGAEVLDTGMIFGTGFPPFRGGLLAWADDEGLARIVEGMKAFAGEGPQFAPDALLASKAASGETFRAVRGFW